MCYELLDELLALTQSEEQLDPRTQAHFVQHLIIGITVCRSCVRTSTCLPTAVVHVRQ
jgi:hypothetical protein